MSDQSVKIPLYYEDKELGVLNISTNSFKEFSFSDFKADGLDYSNVKDFGDPDDETPIQYCYLENGPCLMLLEETSYQVTFNHSCETQKINMIPEILEHNDGVFEPFKLFNETIKGGILNFHSYAGKSFFDVELDGIRSEKVPFEVRSKKINYIPHYIAMLADLSKAVSGILFQQNAPLFQKFYPNRDLRKTHYEDFMFLEYLFLDENLPYAYDYVRKNVYVNLEEDLEVVPTSFASNLGSSGLVDIICTPENLYKSRNPPRKWPKTMKNFVPDRVTRTYYEETVDTPENRLLKHFLEGVDKLIDDLMGSFEEPNYIKERLITFNTKIKDYLSDRWLRDVGKLEHVPMNSQVLQKKEGYRDIFKYYLNFEFSFRPQWEEIEDCINGYERKLSEMYEYWCYFKLLKVMEKLSGQKIKYDDVFTVNYKGWSVDLKRGSNSIQKFKLNIEDQEVYVELLYNKRFSKRNTYYKSYSLNLIPDYTLAVDVNGEKKFIHFDAKYKSRGIPSDENINKKDHIYKFEDVYKMHTYKDAILNTLGAYVLYPGDEEKIFHEDVSMRIHSVGAFPLTPGKDGVEEENLGLFIENNLKNILERKI